MSFASELLRAGVLDGVRVLHVAPASALAREGSTASAVRAACTELGASVWSVEAHGDGDEAEQEQRVDQAVADALASAGGAELAVIDAGALLAAAESAAAELEQHERARVALAGTLQSTWVATRAVVTRGFIEREGAARIIYITPAAGGGEHSDAARAGLENLARTLSIEWARYAITLVALAPAASTAAGEVAALCAYLASPAGAYFSGCELDLSGPAAN
ncbi:MAG: hypothetical protein QOI03_449 [Solirubrobacteraceae bacterium]|nr:hypothetical protein [Solirubrobacteraceae bacterium]